MAVIGTTEIVLIVVDAAILLGVPVVALVLFWKWRGRKQAPPAKGI